MNIGAPLPTRPVASAGKGQNDHLSETVSQVLEPVANVYEGGMEVNSTQDLLSKIDNMNKNADHSLEEIDLDEVDRELDIMEEAIEGGVEDVALTRDEVMVHMRRSKIVASCTHFYDVKNRLFITAYIL